jgi:hypothetical protein
MYKTNASMFQNKYTYGCVIILIIKVHRQWSGVVGQGGGQQKSTVNLFGTLRCPPLSTEDISPAYTVIIPGITLQ